MKLYKTLTLIILAGLLLAACSPGAVPATGATEIPTLPAPQNGSDSQTPVIPTPWDAGVPQPPAADAAQQALAEQLGLDLDQFVLREIEQVEWPNACLGLPQPDEMCAEVITPGFRLVFEADNQRYEVHTNQDGSQFRIAGDLPPGVPSSGQVLPAVAAAQAALAEQVSIALERVRLIEAVPVEWSDSCLGAGRPDESCLLVITPGYRILFEVDGMRYQVHTNQDGSAVRIVDPVNPGAQPGADPDDIANRAQNLLAQQLDIPVGEISLVSLEAVDWPDACLGAQLPGQLCAQVVTPGYRVVFEAQGVYYAFHTDDAGGVIFPTIPPLPETAGTVIRWEQGEGADCTQAEIGVEGVSTGACGAEQQAAQLSPERLIELAYLYAAFPPFEVATPSGTVRLNGQSTEQPGEAEMRSVAEWAKSVAQEAQAEQAEGSSSLAVEWNREGGIAGFCDGLEINLTGWAQPFSCRGGSKINNLPLRLNEDTLQKLYAWTDTLESFEYEQADNASADAMSIRVNFTGSGSETAQDEQRQEIAKLAEDLYNQAMY